MGEAADAARRAGVYPARRATSGTRYRVDSPDW